MNRSNEVSELYEASDGRAASGGAGEQVDPYDLHARLALNLSLTVLDDLIRSGADIETAAMTRMRHDQMTIPANMTSLLIPLVAKMRPALSPGSANPVPVTIYEQPEDGIDISAASARFSYIERPSNKGQMGSSDNSVAVTATYYRATLERGYGLELAILARNTAAPDRITALQVAIDLGDDPRSLVPLDPLGIWLRDNEDDMPPAITLDDLRAQAIDVRDLDPHSGVSLDIIKEQLMQPGIFVDGGTLRGDDPRVAQIFGDQGAPFDLVLTDDDRQRNTNLQMRDADIQLAGLIVANS
jgi:hypothetical protein